MQNQLFADVPESERKRYLSDNADRVEELEYLKPYESDDLTQLQDTFTKVSVEIADIEAEKKRVTDEFNVTLKELKAKAGITLLFLRNKAERVKEQCYMMFDEKTKQVGYYNDKGVLVSSRPMRPGEFQKTVFSGLTKGDEYRTGTDD